MEPKKTKGKRTTNDRKSHQNIARFSFTVLEPNVQNPTVYQKFLLLFPPSPNHKTRLKTLLCMKFLWSSDCNNDLTQKWSMLMVRALWSLKKWIHNCKKQCQLSNDPLKPVLGTIEWDHSLKGRTGHPLSPIEIPCCSPILLWSKKTQTWWKVRGAIPTGRRRAILPSLSDAEILKTFQFSIWWNEIHTHATSWVVCPSILRILADLIVCRVGRCRAMVPFKICWVGEIFGTTDFPSYRCKIHFAVRVSILPIWGQYWSYSYVFGHLLDAASWSLNTESRSLWTATESLRLHLTIAPQAPSLEGKGQFMILFLVDLCGYKIKLWKNYYKENLLRLRQLIGQIFNYFDSSRLVAGFQDIKHFCSCSSMHQGICRKQR